MKLFNGIHVVAKRFISLFPGVGAMTLWPFVFYKRATLLDFSKLRNHETIHIWQQNEIGRAMIVLYFILSLLTGIWTWTLFVLPMFYYLYFINWLIMIPIMGITKAYYEICFEKEAWAYELKINQRKGWGWLKFIW